MSLALSPPAVRPAPRSAVAQTRRSQPVPTRSQLPVTDVVEDWGLASFPASDPPSNW
ncbi:hypothetical protein SAMN05660748_2387 [Blastococcus aggregatus]|uniref:Uncharacterized protein n=1 Tax=Blastococcus aggregatus TaxID=38502 RepID=A0A285V9D2_9ACTN|nr:hypothetical protein [Blastococcus aggregatus]SOC49656.1 hypothetical protein SAMN05660748_2387 [Blastococcus aggregatus]